MRNFLFLTLCLLFLSCSRDADESQKHYVGKWFAYKRSSTFGGSTTTEIFDNCIAKSNFLISKDNKVALEYYENCSTFKTYYGYYDDASKKMSIQFDHSNEVCNVEFVNNEMLLNLEGTTSLIYCKK